MPSYYPGLYEQVEMIVGRMMRHYTAPMPARVVSVSTGQNNASRADIQPLFNLPFQDRVGLELSYIDAQQIFDVPVLVPASGASDSRIKLAPGDVGLWVPTMFSMDQLLDNEATDPVSPNDPKQQPYRSGFFIPLKWNRTLASASSADRIITGAEVQIGDDPATAQSLAFKGSVQTQIDAIWTALDAFGAAAPGALATACAALETAAADPHVVNGTDHLKGT